MSEEKPVTFYPWFKGKRLELEIAKADYQAFKDAEQGDNGYDWVRITDLKSKKQYLARRVSCGLDCFCDAEVKEAKP